MEVLYRDSKIEKLVTSLPHAKRKLSEQTAVKLFKLINLIKAADNWLMLLFCQDTDFINLKDCTA